MLHTLSPYAVMFTENFGIRWYGLSYLTGFVCAYYIILYLSRSNLSFISQELISDYVFYVALGTIIGGRLGYCIFYSPDLFLRFNLKFPFWGVLAVNEGGMASHGGIIGIIISAIIYARKNKLPSWHAVDLAALTGPVGVFFGRLANFVNGELVGRPSAEDFRFGVKFPQDILLWPSYEPQRLPSLGPAVTSLHVEPEKWDRILKNFTSDNTSWHALQDILNSLVSAVQHKNLEVAEALKPVLTLRHPSQLYEAGLEGILLFTILAVCWKKCFRTPGVITGIFLTVYAILRIIGEQFRLPDAQIGYQMLGLTRGQWLSTAMFAVGLIFIVNLLRRKRI
jgi:phosphatidylglycerol:prolipoprotein diacylglycerol transferase